MASTAVNRILDRVEVVTPITVGLLASDLHLGVATVKRYVGKLVEAGRVEIEPDAEFGDRVVLTETEKRERAIDRRVRTHR